MTERPKKEEQKLKQTKNLVSSRLWFLLVPSAKPFLICFANENPRMAEGRNPLSVIPEVSIPKLDGTGWLSPGAMSLALPPFSSLGGRFTSSDLQLELSLGVQAGSASTGSLPWGAMWERMLWVEIVCFNLSRFDYLISIVCYFLKRALPVWFPESF